MLFRLGLSRLAAIVGRHLAFLIGLLVLFGLLLCIEWSAPYFFGIDDSYQQFLPVILDSIHQVESGSFPGMTPHQSMGMPVFATGTYSVTYPGIYLACWIARLCGSEQYFMEVYAILHIVAGYAVTYVLLCRMKVESLIAACAAASFVLGAYVIFQGRTWYYTYPVLVFLPLLVAATIALLQRPTTPSRIAWWGFLCGVYFHAGNSQLWVYTMFFCGLIFLAKVTVSRVWMQKWVALAAAAIVAFVIASPLLIAQYQLVHAVDRHGTSWASMQSCILNYVLWGSEGYPAYTGSLLFGAALMSIMLRKWNVWAAMGVVAILCSLGKPGGIWYIMADSPVFEKFQHPFKFVLFATFFMLVHGAVYVDWTRTLRLAAVLNLVLLILFVAHHAAGFQGDLPYTPLTQTTEELLGSERIYSFASMRRVGDRYAQSMTNNFASYYGKNSISSYSDGLTYELAEQIQQRERIETRPLEALQAYGCRWIIVHESFEMVQAEPDQYAFSLEEVQRQRPIFNALEPHLTERHREAHFTIYELPDVAPLAFPQGSPRQSLPIEVTGSGMRVQLEGLAPEQNDLVVNFLMRPGYAATQGKKRLAIMPDEWGRIQVTLDNHEEDLVITYWPIHW